MVERRMRAWTILVLLGCVACGADGLETAEHDAGVDLDAGMDLGDRGMDLRAGDLSSGACHLTGPPTACDPSAGDVCAALGARCDATSRQCACVTPACTKTLDCNDDLTISALLGHCNAYGACECAPIASWNAQSGKCSFDFCPKSAPVNASPCSKIGQGCSYAGGITCTCARSPSSIAWACAP